MNKEQNKILRNICLILSSIFLLAGIVKNSFLYGLAVPAILMSIFLYLKKSSINTGARNDEVPAQDSQLSDIKKSINSREGDLILGAALITMRELANDHSVGVGKCYDEEQKDKLIFDCLVDIEKTLFEKDKIKAVRLRLMSLMLSCAEMDVLLMKPPTMHRLLSGELEEKIVELFNVNEFLQKDLQPGLPTEFSFEDLKNEIMHRYILCHFYMSAYNTVRISLKDFVDDSKKDWFRACYISFCIWQENVYRTDLNMPVLIENQLKSIAFSGWASIAKENPNDLRESFEIKWRNCFNEPSPFFEIAV